MGAGTLQLPTTGIVSGLTIAQDINTALAALATLNESGAAPTPTSTGLTGTGGVFWHDTSFNLLKLRDQADSVWMPYAQVDETNKLVTPYVAPVYGSTRNLKFTAPGGGATATLTFDEWIGKTAIGGSAVPVASGNLTVNLGSNGADGLDTGSPAANTMYRTYGLYNIAAGTLHTLTTKDSNTTPAPIPSGYVLLSVIGYLLTDSSSHVLAFTQEDRRWMFDAPFVITTGVTFPSTLTAQSISAAVPAGARTASVLMGITSTGTAGEQVAAGDANGLRAQMASLTGGGTSAPFAGFGSAAPLLDVPMPTAQTIYIMVCNGGDTSICRLAVIDFTF